MNISPISPSAASGIGETARIQQPAKGAQQVGQSFQQALEGLDQSQAESDDLLQRLASGENLDIHQVMIAAEETDINFRIALAIRDQLVDAYREVMRMNV